MIINGALAYFKNYFDDYKSEREAAFTDPSNRILLSQLFSRMAATVRNNTSAKLIIVYHPEIKLNDDGSLSLTDNPEAVKIFSELCRENGIYFVNTGARFLDDYQRNHTLPYGFFNSSVGTGHMNKYGHRIFAEEVYKLIQEIERNN